MNADEREDDMTTENHDSMIDRVREAIRHAERFGKDRARAAIEETAAVLQERFDGFGTAEDPTDDFTIGYLAAINDVIAELP